MKAKLVYPPGSILAIPLIVSLWVNITSLPTAHGSRKRDLNPFKASRKNLVHDSDQTESYHTSDRTKETESPARDAQDQKNFEELLPDLNSQEGETHALRGIDIVETLSHVSSTSSCGPSIRQQYQEEPADIDKEILTRQDIWRFCKLPLENRTIGYYRFTGRKYLRNCFRYKIGNLIDFYEPNSIMHANLTICSKILEEYVQLDETIGIFEDLFTKLLSRYNCHNGYSVKWNCDDCKKAYKDWLCATHMPLYMFGRLIKPCISFCERVEQRCPYLHPITREQYGGQPVFICRDPNIPFVPEITPDIPYSEPGKCYDLCHLNPNLTELTIDSLSKYDHCNCPSRESIASTVQPFTQSPPLLHDYDDPDGQDVHKNEQNTENYAHYKKLTELLEVLTNYKNQSKTHRYHADHSSIEHPISQTKDLHRMS